jgi:hypothetical protein
MNYQNPPWNGQASDSSYASAAEQDRRLQPDPELASSEGRAGPIAVTIYFALMAFFVAVVLYGLNHQRSETGEPATAAGAPATSAPAPAPQPQTPQAEGNQANPPAAQQAQPGRPANGQQQPGQQPAAQQPATPSQPNAQQQNQQPQNSQPQAPGPTGQPNAPKQ